MINNYIEKSKNKTLWISLICVIIFCTFSFDIFNYWSVYKQNIYLGIELEKSTVNLNLIQNKLIETKNEKEIVKNALKTETENNAYFQNQLQNELQNITGTVGVLEKLSRTDDELLKKYSKVFFLNENYLPENLINIDEKYLNIKNKPIQIKGEVWKYLKDLLDSAEKDGLNIQVLSGYRSFGAQATLKSAYKITYGAGTANQFSADQGYSEHQLGTTLDFTNPKIGSNLTLFEKTKEYSWLIKNAHKYGFVMSYPKENHFYIFEPWHYRFVGVELATKIYNENIYFYAMDQREIDKYLKSIFD